MPVVFRPAIANDAREIARLFQITSEGASNYIWSQLAEPGEDLLEVGAVVTLGKVSTSPIRTV